MDKATAELMEEITDRSPERFDLYHQMIDNVRDYAIVCLSPEGIVQTWNHGAELIKGYSAEEITGQSFHKFYTEDDLISGKPDLLLQIAGSAGRAEDEGWRVRKDGNRFWASISLTALYDESGDISGYTKITRDLTKRKQAEDELRRSKERFSQMVGEVRDYAILLLDTEGNVVTWNAGAEAIKGYSSFEIIGRSFHTFYTEEDIQSGKPNALLDRAAREGRAEDEGWRVRKSGEYFWAGVVITALHDSNGGITGFSKVTRDLTERKHVEEELRRSEERYSKMVAEVQDYAIILLSVDGEVQTWNAGAKRIKGYEAEEIIGRSFRIFYSEEDKLSGKPARLLERARTEGRVLDEGWRLRKDGGKFWASVVITALHGDDNNVIGYSKVTRDMTEVRNADEKLRRSEERYQKLVSEVQDYAILMLSTQGIVETWNAGAERIKGYSADEIVGKSFRTFYTEDDRRTRKPDMLLQTARTEGRALDEGWRVRKDGGIFWASVTITALHNNTGDVIGFSKVTRDLTEQRTKDEQLRQSEERYHKMIAEVQDYAIISLDPEGIVETWNFGAARIKGYTANEIVGQSFRVFYTAEDLATGKPDRLLDTARETGRANDEGWRLTKDGSRFWAHVIITALHDQYGEIIGFSTVTRDLTERKQAGEELRRSEERYQSMVNEVQDYAILMISPDGYVETWNQGAERIKGYLPDEILGKHIRCFYTQEDQQAEKYIKVLNKARIEGRAEDEGWRVRKNGSKFWASVTLSVIHGQDGEVIGFSKVTRDLTQRKQAEDMQRRITIQLEQRNRDLDQFAYLTSHDLQEPLRTLSSYSRLLSERNYDSVDVVGRKALDFISEASTRMTVMIDELLTHSRLGKNSTLALVNCNDLVNQARKELSVQIRSTGAQIKTVNLPALHGLEQELKLLFYHLIDNAIKFTPANTSPVVDISAKKQSNGWCFSVQDNSIGLTPEQSERIFKIFQRLHKREEYEGTGIGLAHCKKIVEMHNGTIRVESEPGRGCTFLFTIPEVTDDATS